MNQLPAGRHIVEFLATRSEFVGVGKATAKRLWERFGTDLAGILGNGDVGQLAQILDTNQAAIVVDAWRNQQALADCVVFFDEHGIDRALARKAMDFWGDEAVAKIRDNPYRLLTVCPWQQVDRVALRLGLSAMDSRRLVAAVESALYEALDRKHTWCGRDDLIAATCKKLSCSRKNAVSAIDMAEEEGAAIGIDGGFQPAGAAYMERFIESRIARHIDKALRQDLYLDTITSPQVQAFLDTQKFDRPLTEEQSAAVAMAMTNTFSLLIGGAGVGKTTALKAINVAARHFGHKVYQLAIAGRAASRIAMSTGQPAQTVASWLRGVANGEIEVGRHTFIVIDEASMLDLPTLYRILFYLPDDAPMLLVGDIAQLPPIGFGLTLHRLVNEPRIAKTELTRILRAEESTGIPQVSRTVRDGQGPTLPQYRPTAPGCTFHESQADDAVHLIEDILHDLRGEEIQVIAAQYAGDAGIDHINRYFHDSNQRGGALAMHGFAVGDPCIWTKNDYDRRLWNGSMGTILDVSGAGVVATIDGSTHQVSILDLDKIELAYCISVHKAQGSQFKNVVMPIYPTFSLDRAMIYTAITRATDRVVLVGNRETFRRAVIAPPKSLDRKVALQLDR